MLISLGSSLRRWKSFAARFRPNPTAKLEAISRSPVFLQSTGRVGSLLNYKFAYLKSGTERYARNRNLITGNFAVRCTDDPMQKKVHVYGSPLAHGFGKFPFAERLFQPWMDTSFKTDATLLATSASSLAGSCVRKVDLKLWIWPLITLSPKCLTHQKKVVSNSFDNNAIGNATKGGELWWRKNASPSHYSISNRKFIRTRSSKKKRNSSS